MVLNGAQMVEEYLHQPEIANGPHLALLSTCQARNSASCSFLLVKRILGSVSRMGSFMLEAASPSKLITGKEKAGWTSGT